MSLGLLGAAVVVTHVAMAIGLNDGSVGPVGVIAFLIATGAFLFSWGDWVENRKQQRTRHKHFGQAGNPSRRNDFAPLLVLLSGPVFVAGAILVYGAA